MCATIVEGHNGEQIVSFSVSTKGKTSKHRLKTRCPATLTPRHDDDDDPNIFTVG